MNAHDAESIKIKPLTKRTRQGELYTRRTETQLQIEKLLNLEKPQILAMLENGKKRTDNDYLLDETLVFLLRQAKIAADDDMIESLYLELNRRIWNLLLRFRADFRTNQTDFEDFGQRVSMAILRKIFDTDSDSADFAQAQFGSFVISEAKGIRKQNFVKIKRDQDLFETGHVGEENENRLENIALITELSAENRLIFAEGLRKLPHEQQTVAAMLLDGFQIESKDENEPTISRHLQVSSRTIRNWIREMRLTLTDYQGEVRR